MDGTLHPISIIEFTTWGGGNLLRTMTFKYDLKNFKSTSFYKSGVKLYFEPTKKEVGHWFAPFFDGLMLYSEFAKFQLLGIANLKIGHAHIFEMYKKLFS